MSLILGYANKDNAIIMSDGHAGKDGCYSEHYNKTRKINHNIILGFAGFVESTEYFWIMYYHKWETNEMNITLMTSGN